MVWKARGQEGKKAGFFKKYDKIFVMLNLFQHLPTLSCTLLVSLTAPEINSG